MYFQLLFLPIVVDLEEFLPYLEFSPSHFRWYRWPEIEVNWDNDPKFVKYNLKKRLTSTSNVIVLPVSVFTKICIDKIRCM
jgi:hypothetical protein